MFNNLLDISRQNISWKTILDKTILDRKLLNKTSRGIFQTFLRHFFIMFIKNFKTFTDFYRHKKTFQDFNILFEKVLKSHADMRKFCACFGVEDNTFWSTPLFEKSIQMKFISVNSKLYIKRSFTMLWISKFQKVDVVLAIIQPIKIKLFQMRHSLMYSCITYAFKVPLSLYSYLMWH